VDSDLVEALIAAAIWIAVLVTVRWSLGHAFDRYEQRLAERDAAVAARRRTTFSFLLRIIIALVGLIGVWSVLSKFSATQQIASAFLASSAVLAVIAGLALTTPLGNLSVPIGSHEIVWKHPTLGERSKSVAVTLQGPVRVSIDFSK